MPAPVPGSGGEYPRRVRVRFQALVSGSQSLGETDLAQNKSEAEATENITKLSHPSSSVAESTAYIDTYALYDSVSLDEVCTYGTEIYIHSESYLDVNLAHNLSDPFVDHVVEIVDRLCASENDLEFEVTREGNLLIRQAKRGLWRPIVEDSESQTEPTLQFPEIVH